MNRNGQGPENKGPRTGRGMGRCGTGRSPYPGRNYPSNPAGEDETSLLEPDDPAQVILDSRIYGRELGGRLGRGHGWRGVGRFGGRGIGRGAGFRGGAS